MYPSILFEIKDVYKIVSIANGISLCEGSSPFLSEISKSDSAIFNQIRSLGGKQYL